MPPLDGQSWVDRALPGRRMKKLRTRLKRMLEEDEDGVPSTTSSLFSGGVGALDEEWQQLLVRQLLPAVGAAIDAQLVIEHISAVQEAVRTSNEFWGRCLRQVQRTEPIA